MADDVWFFIRGGKIIKRTENDGWAYLRDGPQARDMEVSREYMEKFYPQYWERYLKAEWEANN